MQRFEKGGASLNKGKLLYIKIKRGKLILKFYSYIEVWSVSKKEYIRAKVKYTSETLQRCNKVHTPTHNIVSAQEILFMTVSFLGKGKANTHFCIRSCINKSLTSNQLQTPLVCLKPVEQHKTFPCERMLAKTKQEGHMSPTDSCQHY